MKKITVAAALIFAGSSLVSCGDTTKIDSLIVAQEETTSPDTSHSKLYEELGVEDSSSGDYDVDLTQLSSGMVYGQVYDMVYNPDDYVGKKIKAKGPFSYFKDDVTGNEYFAVVISDATACCSQGIEFVLDGTHVYPDDYPELGTEITVTGDFTYYTEDMMTYCQLQHAQLSMSW